MPKIEIPIAELQKRKLFVATPMYGGQCYGTYAKACLDLVSLCMKYGVQCQFFYLFNESLITRARNYLADEFIRSDATHLLFIDSDIDFNPMDVLALLAFDKDIIGGPYPKKTIAWEKIYDATKLGMVEKNPLELEKFSGDYVFNAVPGTTEIRMDTPVPVLEIGTGFMMVKKDVFAKFRAAYPDLSYKPDHNRTVHFDGSREIHAFFDTVIDPKTKRYLSEDYMFCQWARNIGIEIYLCPWMKLKHTGTYIFGGNMEDLARLSHAQAAAGHSTAVARSIDEVVPMPAQAQLADPASSAPVSAAPAVPEGKVAKALRKAKKVDQE